MKRRLFIAKLHTAGHDERQNRTEGMVESIAIDVETENTDLASTC